MMNRLHFDTSGPLGVFTLANPPLNLLSGELLDELGAAIKNLKHTSIRALLLRADGKIFCAGADVSAFKGRSEREARESFTEHQQMIADLEALPFPTLAAVQGMCVGGGLELVLACDLIWAAASARLGQLEATIGTTTLLGGVQRLAERAGSSRAREIIYTAEPYDAATFERWNIVNRVVADDVFESETRAFAERLANGPTLAYAAGKRMVRAYLDGGIRAADKVVGEVGPPLFQSEDMRAAVAALVRHGARNFRDKVLFQGR
jgi:enoyl-CoA hydratase/carnithine racemase